MHDPLKIKKRIHKNTAKLDNHGIIKMRVNNPVHLHGPHKNKIAANKVIGVLIDLIYLVLTGTNQYDLTVGMPVFLVASVLHSRRKIKCAHPAEIIYFVITIIHNILIIFSVQLFAQL